MPLRIPVFCAMTLAAFAGNAAAQDTKAAPTDLSLPMFAASAGDPYSLNVANAQTGPAGTVAVTQTAPMQGYSFDEFRHSIQGYVTAGVSSRGGRGVEGGVLLPLVPGKAELEIGGGTGQVGDLTPGVARLKHSTVAVTDYHATLYLHPTEDLDVTIGYAGADFSKPHLTR